MIMSNEFEMNESDNASIISLKMEFDLSYVSL